MTDVRGLWRARRGDERKGDFGRVLVVGGSERYAGAPAFNALAALRAGADIAVVVAPRRAADLVAGYAPDLITIPCDTPWPDPAVTLAEAERADAVVLGGGVERSEGAHAALRDIVRACAKPMVVDAEAVRALADDPAALRGKRALLTPHGGEFEAIAGAPWPNDEHGRAEAALSLAKRLGVAVIVKGARDVIADGARVAVDEAGSPFLTKGGYGDLLAGAAGALLARAVEPFDAARGAAWLVGTAGRRAAEELGEATLASDALARFGAVLRSG